MKKCKHCGADFGLHQYGVLQCPKDGLEAPIGEKQEWETTVFALEPDSNGYTEALDKAAQTAALFLRDLQELNRLSGVAESELFLIYIGEVARTKSLLKRLVAEKTTVK